MITKLLALTAVIFTVGVATGCGGSSEKADPPKNTIPYPDVGAFCNAIATAECSDAIGGACNLASKDACIQSVQNACNAGKSDITYGRTVSNYKAAKGQACVDAVKAAYADGKVEATEFTAVKKACDIAFSAAQAEGFACKIDTDCDIDQGLFCYLTEPTTGKCRKPGTVAKGDDCSINPCAAGLVCSKDHICYAGRAAGSPCTIGTDPCTTDLLCDTSQTANGMGTCGAKYGQGAACTANEQCATGFCARLPTQKDPDHRECFTSLQYGAGSSLCDNFKLARQGARGGRLEACRLCSRLEAWGWRRGAWGCSPRGPSGWAALGRMIM